MILGEAATATNTTTKTTMETAPLVVITSPSRGDPVTAGPITVSANGRRRGAANCAGRDDGRWRASSLHVRTHVGEGVDRVGNRATTTVTVRIDRMAPRVTMTSPSDRLVTADGTLTVTGVVSDDGSGVGRVTCNGMPVQLGEGGVVSCAVPLRPGLNPIILHATDVAGNSASVGVRATRVAPAASLTIAPSQRTILVGETRSLQVVDQGGLPVASDVGWTVDNAAVASLTSESGRATVQGLAAGTATVTVTHAGLTATAEINVIAAASLPTGAVRWKSLTGSSGIATTSGPLYATRVDEAVPDLYVLQGTVSGSQQLQGVFLDGTLANAWDVSPPVPGTSDVWLALADRAGGVVLGTRDWSTGTGGLVRIPGTPDALPWRYDPPTTDAEVVGQSPDGTIYLLEHVGQSWQVVGLDGDTGAVKFRYTPPGTSHSATYNIDCHAGYHSIGDSGPELSHAVVGYDGALYAIARTGTSVYDYFSQEGCNQSGATPTDYHATVSVVRVTADGAGRVDELQTKAGTTPEALDLHGDTLVPDPRGGVHAQWNSISFDWNTYEQTGDTRHARVGAESSGEQQMGMLPFDRIGDGVGFDASGVAYDLDTGAVKFSPALAGTFITALAGGGVAVTDGDLVTTLDENGTGVGTPLPLPTSAYSGLPATFGGMDLWTVVEGQALSLLEGEALSDYPAVYPDLNGANQPGTAKAIEVAVHLKTPWWSEINQQEDKDLIRAAAESELNKAYRGYVVSFTFDEQWTTSDAKRRHVWVYSQPGPGNNVGVTYPMLKYSDVYLRSLEGAFLTVRCPGPEITTLALCSTQTGIPRPALVTALGRGLGATIAHELGHQAGLGFSEDLESTPSNCYDAKSAVHLDHFSGQLEWSPEARVLMSKMLLRR